MNTQHTNISRLEICRRFVASVRHSTELKLDVLDANESSVKVFMPYQDAIVGNPETQVLHGGAIFALMDQSGGLAGACAIYPEFEITPTIDMRVDHIRAPEIGYGVLCQAECYRLTQHVVFVRMNVFEERNPKNLVATGVATYMRMKLPGANKVVS